MKLRKIVSALLLSILLLGLIGNFLLPSVKGISGHKVSYPMYGLEEIPLPSGFNTSGYPQVIETSNQLWVAGGGTDPSQQYRGGIWNYTNGEWIKFRNSTGSAGADLSYAAGYQTWAMFNGTHHFFDEAGPGGKTVFTNDTGKTFYITKVKALLGKE